MQASVNIQASAIIVNPKEEFLLDVVDFYKKLVAAENEHDSGSGDALLIYRYARVAIILLVCAVESHANVLLRHKGQTDLVDGTKSILTRLKCLGIKESSQTYEQFKKINEARKNIVHEKGKMNYSLHNSKMVYDYYSACIDLIELMYSVNKMSIPERLPRL